MKYRSPAGIFSILMLLAGCASTPAPTINSTAWVDWYQQWRGTPYQYGGNNRSGIDCSALVQQAYLSIYQMNLPRTTKQQRKLGQRVRQRNVRTGDLLFFKPKNVPNHVGIYVGGNRFIHASSSKGVTIAELNNNYWLPRLIEIRRPLP